MNSEPFGVLETESRKFKSGHILRVDHSVKGWIRIYCDGPGCGFKIEGLEDDKEFIQYQAWRHRTEPRLLLPGTSDILKPTRMSVLHAELAKAKRRET